MGEILNGVKSWCFTCLVRSLVAEVDDNLRSSGVESVKVGSVFSLQTLPCEVVNTPETVHQLAENDDNNDDNYCYTVVVPL